MKKKIIFVTKALWIGGIETALVNLLNYFDYDKYEVTLLVLHAKLDMKDQINPKCRLLIADREQKISFDSVYRYKKLFHLTEKTDKPSKLHKAFMWGIPAIKWLENRLYIRYIRKLMKDQHFDTAIIYSDVVAEITIRGIAADKFLMFYHHGAMRHVYHDKIGYKKCEKIIVVSKNQANELKKFIPKYRDKIVSVHNLTNIEEIREKGQMGIEELFDSSRFNIVSVGRVSHEKGMDIAVKVCAKLISDGYKNVKWWIIGDGPAMQEVRDTIKQLKVEDYIILTGMKSNPYPYIEKADLYVQPSRFEGYPMTILEALVLGQPVISTDNNGAREIIKEGITGILSPIQVDQMATTIEMFLNDRYSFEKMKKNVAELDFDTVNQNCIKLLETVL